jgi:hypothetical protein
MFDGQDETGRDYNNQIGLGGNLVQEGNLMAEGEELGEQYQTNQNQIATNDIPGQTKDDNSFHMDKYIEKFHEDPKFSEKEKEISQKLDNILRSKTGKSISSFSGYIFMVNKVLMLSTFTEFLFQRFDIVTLFLNFIIILIELGIFSHKHMYKWIIVLLGSLLLDALVLLDISPVS